MPTTRPVEDHAPTPRVVATRVVIASVVLAAIAVLVLAASTCRGMWPPLRPPGSALGVVLEREGCISSGAAWRIGNQANALRIFGVDDARQQERILERARDVLRRFPQKGPFVVEFWSGPVPPADSPGGFESAEPGRTLIRAVHVAR